MGRYASVHNFEFSSEFSIWQIYIFMNISLSIINIFFYIGMMQL